MKNIAKTLIALLISSALVLIGAIPAQAETDPFPGVDHMAEIPGTRVSSPAGYTQAQWEATPTYQAFSCPSGSGNAISIDVTAKIWSAYCVKTWQPTSTIDAWQKYYQEKQAARDVAYQASLAWNTENPGKQLCFEWGPITSPDGGQSSGGVCANPVKQTPTDPGQQVVADPGSSQTPSENSTTEVSAPVASFINSLQAIPASTQRTKITIPNLRKTKKLGVSVRVVSKSPRVCAVRNSKVIFVGSGNCSIRISVQVADGKRLASLIKILKS